MSTRSARLLLLAQEGDSKDPNNKQTTTNTRPTPKRSSSSFSSSSTSRGRNSTGTKVVKTNKGSVSFLQPQGVSAYLSKPTTTTTTTTPTTTTTTAEPSIGKKRSLFSTSSTPSSSGVLSTTTTKASLSSSTLPKSDQSKKQKKGGGDSAEVIPPSLFEATILSEQQSITIPPPLPLSSSSSSTLMVGRKTKTEEEEEYGLALTASRGGGAKRQTAEQKAMLPERWKRLEEMFWALEMAVSQCSLSLRHASSLNLFPRLAERVRTVTHYTFGSSHLAQISAVYPNAYHAKRSGASATTTITPTDVTGTLSSEIADVFLEVKDHSELFTRNVNLCLEKRRVTFRAALLRRLESLHNDFLRTKENTNSSKTNNNNTKRRAPAKGKKGKSNVEETGDEARYLWHKDFPLEEVEDIEEADFIEEQQPSETDSSPFKMAHQQQLQQTKLAASSSQTTTKSKDTNSPLPTMEDLVRKVREKEERLAESADRVARKKHINGLMSLVDMTRGFYCAEKKSVMHLHMIATKLVASANTTCVHQSGGSDVFSSVEEVKKMLTKLALISPEWCSIIDIEGTSYLKVNSKIDLLATKKKLLQTLTTETETQPMQM